MIKEIKKAFSIYELISEEATGNPNQFCSAIGISKRQLLRNIKHLKDTGINIEYSRKKSNYYFLEPLTKRDFLDKILHSEISANQNE